MYASDVLEFVKEDGSIDIVAKFEIAEKIIFEALSLGFSIAMLNIDGCEYEGYTDEYVVSLSQTDGKKEVWCEKFKRNYEYFELDSPVMYILDDCNSRVIPYCKGGLTYEVSIGEDDLDVSYEDNLSAGTDKSQDADYSESFHISKSPDDRIAGFMKSWATTKDGISTYSSYSHYCDNEELVKSVARDFGINI